MYDDRKNEKAEDLSHIIEKIRGEIIPGLQELSVNGNRQKIDNITGSMESLMEQLEVKSREMRESTIRDSLTRLYNRGHLVTVLEDELARSQRYGHPVAVMMIDIDDFRTVNAKLGQQSGDRMLTFTGRIIKENIRKFDRAFRYGGEEFVVVLPETDMTMAHIVAERIRKNFQSRIPVFMSEFSDEPLSTTLSIGVTSTYTYSLEEVSTEDLISQTEEALARAKARGGNMSFRFRG
jgi:diguanylate cyclase (GGDEF)-like protein